MPNTDGHDVTISFPDANDGDAVDITVDDATIAAPKLTPVTIANKQATFRPTTSGTKGGTANFTARNRRTGTQAKTPSGALTYGVLVLIAAPSGGGGGGGGGGVVVGALPLLTTGPAAFPQNVPTYDYSADLAYCANTKLITFQSGSELANMSAFQSAIATAQDGDRFVIRNPQYGMRGSWRVPAIAATNGRWIIMPENFDNACPPTQRLTLADRQNRLKHHVNASYDIGIDCAVGAHGLRLIGLDLTQPPDVTYNTELAYFGHPNLSAVIPDSEMPHDIWIDRCWIHNGIEGTQHTSASQYVRTAVFFDVQNGGYVRGGAKAFSAGEESRAILMENTKGQLLFNDLLLIGPGQTLFTAGEHTRDNVTPSDILEDRIHHYCPDAWLARSDSARKTFEESKNSLRRRIIRAVYDGCWPQAQAGFAFLFKNVNQDNRAGESANITADITLQAFLFKRCCSGMTISNRPEAYPVTTNNARFFMEQGILDLLDATYGGPSWGIMPLVGAQASVGVDRIVMRKITNLARDIAVEVPGQQGTPLNTNCEFTNMIMSGNYGERNDFGGSGNDGSMYANGGAMSSFANTVTQGIARYNRGVGPYNVNGDLDLAAMQAEFWPSYKMSAGDPRRGTGTDGKDPGADVDDVMASLAGVQQATDLS